MPVYKSPTPRRARLTILSRIGAGIILLAAAMPWISPNPARAEAVFIVDTPKDLVDQLPGDGKCETVVRTCSLRAAVMEMNTAPGSQAILLPGGQTYPLELAGAGEDQAKTGDLDLNQPVTLTGTGEIPPVIDGSGLDRILDIHGPVQVTLAHVKLTGGSSGANGGGAVRVGGGAQLTMDRVVLDDNRAEGPGGGVYSEGTVSLDGTILRNNLSLNAGGGFYLGPGGQASLSRSLLEGNSAASGGGLAAAQGANSLNLENVTFHNNTAQFQGGGLYLQNPYSFIQSVTVTANQAPVGSGLYLAGGALLTNSILAENTATNCAGPGKLTTNGRNLEDGESCAFSTPGDGGSLDLHNVDPLLGPLQDNGGPVPTRALLPESPAIDRGDLPYPVDDARGIPRPSGAGFDLGAYEKVQPSAPPGCRLVRQTFTAGSGSSQAIPAEGQLISRLQVTGLGRYLWDLDLQTQIDHPDARFLKLALISPGGREVSIWNGRTVAEPPLPGVFRGTLWDDHALSPASLFRFSGSGPITPLSPEGAFGGLVGSNPNGEWRLVLTGLGNPSPAHLEGWTLRLAACPDTFLARPAIFVDTTSHELPASSRGAYSLIVSKVGPSLASLDLEVTLEHPRPADLVIRLTSPGQTSLTIASHDLLPTAQAGGARLVFDDHALAPVGLSASAPSTILIPRTALAVFNGENPNGIWKLEIEDTRPGEAGTLAGWALHLQTVDGTLGTYLPVIRGD